MPQSAVISAAATTKSAIAKAAASDDGSSSEDEKSQPNKMNGKTGTPSKVDRQVVHLHTSRICLFQISLSTAPWKPCLVNPILRGILHILNPCNVVQWGVVGLGSMDYPHLEYFLIKRTLETSVIRQFTIFKKIYITSSKPFYFDTNNEVFQYYVKL